MTYWEIYAITRLDHFRRGCIARLRDSKITLR